MQLMNIHSTSTVEIDVYKTCTATEKEHDTSKHIDYYHKFKLNNANMYISEDKLH